MKKRCAAFLCVVFIMSVSLSGCAVLESFKSTPEKTVYSFLKAINKKDFNKALEYIEPSQAKGITAILNLAGGFIGIDLNTLLDTIPILSVEAGEEVENFQFQFEITEVEQQYEDEAKVTGIEHTSGEEMTFYLVMEDNTWYICLDDF